MNSLLDCDDLVSSELALICPDQWQLFQNAAQIRLPMAFRLPDVRSPNGLLGISVGLWQIGRPTLAFVSTLFLPADTDIAKLVIRRLGLADAGSVAATLPRRHTPRAP